MKRENVRKHKRDILLGLIPDIDRRPLVYAKEAELVIIVVIIKRRTK